MDRSEPVLLVHRVSANEGMVSDYARKAVKMQTVSQFVTCKPTVARMAKRMQMPAIPFLCPLRY